MTLIAATPDGIYYDTQATAQGVLMPVEKMHKVSDTIYAAGAGSTSHINIILEDFKEGNPMRGGENNSVVFFDCEKQEYRLFDVDVEGGIKYEDLPARKTNDFITIGTGGQLFWAYYAKYGNCKTAAIKAIKHANGCGGELWLLRLNGERVRCW